MKPSRTHGSLRSGLCLILLAVACTGRLRAQSATQSVQGLITSGTGVILQGAKVTLTNTATGVARSIVSNDTGNYSFPLVEVGNYDLVCEKDGFQTEAVRGLHVETAAQLRQNFMMQSGQVQEAVEVSASTVSLTTESATVGGVVENKRIIELPLNGRNIVSLAMLVPGVQFGERTGRGDGLGGFPIPGQSFSVSANGQREIHQVVSVDGVDAKDPRIHITNFVPSVEALEEFKVQTTAYLAEYGFAGGAVVSLTTKSGTNDLHATVFEFLRNDKLDAENYFLNFQRPAGQPLIPKDKLRRNQFGALASGPIARNKTFWAFDWESRRERFESVQTAFFPSDRFRAGDFSELARGTVNPATGRLFRAPILIYDPFTGDAFPNNIIPRSQIHPGALNIINTFLPRAEFRQADPLDFTARKGVAQLINTNQYFGRLDHHISDRYRLFGRLTVDRSRYDNSFINPNFPVFTTSNVVNLATLWVHTINQDAINEFRFGFNVSNDTLESLHNTDPNFDVDKLGIGDYHAILDGNRKLRAREQGVPIMSFSCTGSGVGGGPCLGERINGNGLDRMHTYQFGDHVSLIRGKHNVKTGGEVYRISMERAAANQAQGSITFSSAETGYNFASFLLGLPSRTVSPEAEPLTFPGATRFGLYAQDDWKATAKLTVNVGLRFDYNGNPKDAQGLWRTLDFVGEGASVGRGKGFRTPNGQLIPTIFPESVDQHGAAKLFQQDVKFFMPRLGIAYRPTDKWVVRIGAGWFDNINPMNTWSILNLMPPKSGSLQFDAVTDTSQVVPVIAADGNTYVVRTRTYRGGSPVPSLSDPFLQKFGDSSPSRPVNLLHVKPDTKDGDVWKWNFDIQRELPMRTALTVGYVGAKGSHIGNSIGNFNDARPSPDTNFQSRRPFQRFFDPALPQLGVQTLGAIRYLDSYGNSFYHALQVQVEKRLPRGVTYGLAYTFSKSHGDGENGGDEGADFQDPRNRGASRGRFRFDQRHNFVAHYVWELPGQSLRGPLKYLLGGWQTNGVLSIRSGFPFTVSGGSLNTGSDARPDRIADGRIDDPTRAKWYDPQAFRRVTCNIPSRLDLCHYGSSGVNILDSPGQRNLDFSLYKNFPLAERYKLQLRSEFFNAFNTPYFGQPNNIGFATNDSIVPDAPRQAEIRTLRTPMRIIQFGLKLFF